MIAITLGDPGGIGIEVVLKALSDLQNEVFLFGNKKAITYYAEILNLKIPKKSKIIDIEGNFDVGKQSKENGKISYKSLIKAIETAKQGLCKAIVTAPINKKSLHLAGYKYPGHTEILAKEFSTEKFVMMMAAPKIKIAFVTTHIPFSLIPQTISKELIKEKVLITDKYLRYYWNLKHPSLGILALNPHAGDSGLFGDEEERIIKPAIKELKEKGLNIDGPFPADTYWSSQKKDCTIALYHDQGMIPFKIKGFGKGVNITLGLPIIRTSPDHGTAFNIAGKGVANPSSMKEAIKTALKMINV
jgi:4-hydroxythreonine-4-phosphate dehydrogenase